MSVKITIVDALKDHGADGKPFTKVIWEAKDDDGKVLATGNEGFDVEMDSKAIRAVLDEKAKAIEADTEHQARLKVVAAADEKHNATLDELKGTSPKKGKK